MLAAFWQPLLPEIDGGEIPCSRSQVPSDCAAAARNRFTRVRQPQLPHVGHEDGLVSPLGAGHLFGHDPMILAKAAHACEPLALEDRQAAVLKEGSGNLSVGCIFWVALNQAAAQAGDLRKRASKRHCCDALASVLFVHEEASYPPIGWLCLSFVVGAKVLDARKLIGRAELAPAYGLWPVIDKCGMSRTLADPRLLLRTPMRAGLLAFGVKREAPASAPNAFVPLHERSKIGPSGRGERLDGEAGHAWLL